MAAVSIKVNTEDAARFCELFPERALRGTVRALNRSINSGRTVMKQLIAKETGLKAGDVNDALRVSEATFSRPEAELTASVKRIPLIKFKARGPEPSRGRGRGVSYSLQSGAGRLEHAFIATVGAGHRGVFVRMGKARTPIKEKFGPSIGAVFDRYQDQGVARVQDVLQSNLEHELQFAASGLSVGEASDV